MRFSLIVCLLLLGSLRPLLTYAQTKPRPAESPLTLVAVTDQDTVQAIHHYFKEHRQSGKKFLVAGLLTIPVAMVITLGQALTSFGANDHTGELGGVLVNIGLLGGVAPGLFLKLKFRRAKEKALVEGYEQHQVLPANMRQKLRTKYFD